jgi:lactaldehyde dehydrogenase
MFRPRLSPAEKSARSRPGGVPHIDEAVEFNRSVYGLQAAIFTNDITRAFDIAYRLDVGGVIVNWSSAVRVETLPFGGVKMSGLGREGIHDTLLDMTHQKSILIYNALS